MDKAIREAAGPFAIAAQTKTILEQLGRKLEAGECAHTDSFGMTNCKGVEQIRLITRILIFIEHFP